MLYAQFGHTSLVQESLPAENSILTNCYSANLVVMATKYAVVAVLFLAWLVFFNQFSCRL